MNTQSKVVGGLAVLLAVVHGVTRCRTGEESRGEKGRKSGKGKGTKRSRETSACWIPKRTT